MNLKNILCRILCMAIVISAITATCASAELGPTEEAYALTEYALDWYETGDKTYPSGRCLAYVNDCMMASLGVMFSRDCALCGWNEDQMSTSSEDIPLGATVYFLDNRETSAKCYVTNKPYSHAGLYVGDGYIIHTYNGAMVKEPLEAVMNWSNYTYLGWGWHGGYSLGSTTAVGRVNAVNVETDGNKAYISWKKAANAVGYDCYVVEAKEGFPWACMPVLTYTNSCTVTLEPGKTYYAYVVPRNAYTAGSSSQWQIFACK